MYFTRQQLENSPSRRDGISSDDELLHRQNAAYLIQVIGKSVQASQTYIHTAIVYMHRYYAVNSITEYNVNAMAAGCICFAFMAEGQPGRLDPVIQAGRKCLNQQTSAVTFTDYRQQVRHLVSKALLETLGPHAKVDHPHQFIAKICRIYKASENLEKTSYFLASKSLHLTAMCVQYRPAVVACTCFHLACKSLRYTIPSLSEDKQWFECLDESVTGDLMGQLITEFKDICAKTPQKFQSQVNSIKPANQELRMVDLRTMNRFVPQQQGEHRSSSSGLPLCPIVLPELVGETRAPRSQPQHAGIATPLQYLMRCQKLAHEMGVLCADAIQELRSQSTMFQRSSTGGPMCSLTGGEHSVDPTQSDDDDMPTTSARASRKRRREEELAEGRPPQQRPVRACVLAKKLF